jgi:hypothetical protein
MPLSVKSIPREHVLAVWGELEPWLAKVVGLTGKDDCLDVLGHILTGDYQCIVAVDDRIKAVCITQFSHVRAGKICTIVYVAGEGLTEWVNFVDIIEDWCKAQEVIRVEGIGRAGWEKILSSKGYRRVATNIRKDLTSGK